MTKLKKTAGIDISKLVFDVCLMDEAGSATSHQFSNDLSGFKKMVNWMGPEATCVMEATGPYYLKLAVFLHTEGYPLSVVNPLVIKRFSQMRLSRAKTDKVDATLIASYGLTQNLSLWTPPSRHTIALNQLMALADQLVKEHTALCNQLQAFTTTGMMDKQTENLYKLQLAFNQKTQAAVANRMDNIIHQHHKELMARLTSIPGIGKKTAIALIALTEGFSRFNNHKQLSAYFGLSPRIYQSGNSVRGKAAICKMGMATIRKLLYMCSWSAVRCNAACREFYKRLLQRGKPKMVALIAVVNKLIKQAFAIAKNNLSYDPHYKKNICF